MKALLRKLWRAVPTPIRSSLWRGVELGFARYVRLVDLYNDRRLGIRCGRIKHYIPEEQASIAFADAASNMATAYLLLKSLRRYLNPRPTDMLVDLGCGDGRVVFLMADSPIGRCLGIDFAEDAVARAEQNLSTYKRDRMKIQFAHGDAAKHRFTNETILFLGNPFGIDTLRTVIDNLHASLKDNPRPLRLCYFNPLHKSYIDSLPWLTRVHEVRSFKKPILVYQYRRPSA